MTLLTQERLSQTRKISKTFNSDRFNSFEKEARDVHLRLLLGDALYSDLISNSTDEKYVTLLNGEDYVNSQGDTVIFYGLLEYLSYAWLYINAVEGDDFQSNIGTVNFNQQNQFTQRPGGKSYTLKKYQDSMIIYKNNSIDYLNVKNNTYQLWEGNNKDSRGKFQFISI